MTQALQFDGRYSCPACADRFESVGEKKRHIRDHHPKKGNR